MAIVVITPPSALVDWETAAAHLRLGDDDTDQTLVMAYVAAACAHIDGPAGWLGRSIGAQVLEWRGCFDGYWPRRDGVGHWAGERLRLPYGPVASLTSIKYDDTAGAEQTLDPAAYVLRSDGVVDLTTGHAWPSTRAGAESVRVRYAAGASAVPAPIAAAVLLMTGDLYANRETGLSGDRAASAAIVMSTTVQDLLAPYRIWTV